MLQGTNSQHIFKDLVDSFGLSISLRVIRLIEIQLHIYQLMQSFPELCSELGTFVGYDLLRYTMKTDYS
jgi:hypothetical protein